MNADGSAAIPRKRALIIGAGPAGLTAAHELLARTDVEPLIFEADPQYVGGISKTVTYAGNSIDIGGHRFFSKSDRVMEWWKAVLPLAHAAPGELAYQGSSVQFDAKEGTDDEANAFLVRNRKSRIYYQGTFFDYPVTLSWDTLRKLGFSKVLRIAITYAKSRAFPRIPESSLEDFFLNRFGAELYQTFFRSYTEKVWGVPCSEISAEWGAQRVKGLSVTGVVWHALRKPFQKLSLAQKGTETSLIERFLYPSRGPGHLWETVARGVQKRGGTIHMGQKVIGIEPQEDGTMQVRTREGDGREYLYAGDYVLSTMPIKELGAAMDAPTPIQEITGALEYRDFITVGILIARDGTNAIETLTDTWLYIHNPDVHVGRIQIFNNWSPYLVEDPEGTVWIGLEYFCKEGDALWSLDDAALAELAAQELAVLGLANVAAVRGSVTVRQPKAYTSYTGAYARFPEVRAYLDSVPNLFPMGRNGMHRYNNQDHSMLVAMRAVDLIAAGDTDSASLWEINESSDYHEEK